MLIGLPRMHKESGELRDFLPDFVSFLAHQGASEIVLEEGYGSGIGCNATQYLRASPRIKFGSYEDCLSQDLVVVLRCPDSDALDLLRPGAILLSMLHYATNPRRSVRLLERGVVAVSIDSIVDDGGARMVENMSAVGWNGVEAAFRELQHSHPAFDIPRRPPLVATILGSGAVAGAAAFASARYGDMDLRARMVAKGVRGVEVTLIDYDLTSDEDYLLTRLERTDVLVDASRRPDPTKTIVRNAWVNELPKHAVILDLAADPYDFSVSPPVVKGIEGVPQGDLDRFVFHVNDPVYDELNRHLDAAHRRLALSCYSWPGIHPRECMVRYGGQLEPVMEVILSKPTGEWNPMSDNHLERAVTRAKATTWAHQSNA